MIEFKNVYLQYVSEFYSLYNFSCEINYHTLFIGDFFSGTNAIMRTLSKIDKTYKGEIFIDNVNLKNIKNKDLNLAYLTEKPILFKNKNIFKNLYFPLKIRKNNKKSVKNLIFCIFFELKNNNLNFLFNYLNTNNCDFSSKNNVKNSQIERILKLKVKNLTLSEQKVIALIRALLRKPKLILLENFFKNLDIEHKPVVEFIINKLKSDTTFIACENEFNDLYKDFNVVDLANKKKED